MRRCVFCHLNNKTFLISLYKKVNKNVNPPIFLFCSTFFKIKESTLLYLAIKNHSLFLFPSAEWQVRVRRGKGENERAVLHDDAYGRGAVCVPPHGRGVCSSCRNPEILTCFLSKFAGLEWRGGMEGQESATKKFLALWNILGAKFVHLNIKLIKTVNTTFWKEVFTWHMYPFRKTCQKSKQKSLLISQSDRFYVLLEAS